MTKEQLEELYCKALESDETYQNELVKEYGEDEASNMRYRYHGDNARLAVFQREYRGRAKMWIDALRITNVMPEINITTSY